MYILLQRYIICFHCITLEFKTKGSPISHNHCITTDDLIRMSQLTTINYYGNAYIPNLLLIVKSALHTGSCLNCAKYTSLSNIMQLWTRQYSNVIMSVVAYQITGVSIVCSAVCSGADQGKQQSSASMAFVRGNHRWRGKYFHWMTSLRMTGMTFLLFVFPQS